jgi:hypothetical protein
MDESTGGGGGGAVSAPLKTLGTEVTISLTSHLSSMHNIYLKVGFDTYMLRTWFREIGAMI